jgi:hypothetical protein
LKNLGIAICVTFLLAPGTSAGLGTDVTVVNSFQCPEADEILGLFDHPGWNVLMFASNVNDRLYFYDYTGFYIGEFILDYPSPNPFGCVYSGAVGWYYVNDFLTPELHLMIDSNWYGFDNPTSTHGRGMHWVGSQIWETYGDSRIYRFWDSIADPEYFETPEVHGSMSGLTLFAFGDYGYVMVTCYDPPHRFYFYRTDGTYEGYEDIPFDVGYALGLAYCDERDTCFFSCTVDGEYYIYELDFNFYDDTGIEASSLGKIKTAFR